MVGEEEAELARSIYFLDRSKHFGKSFFDPLFRVLETAPSCLIGAQTSER